MLHIIQFLEMNCKREIQNYKASLVFLIISLLTPIFLLSQIKDWRNARNGHLISTNGYADQPYIIVLKSGKWLCFFTTGNLDEGGKGQHIASCYSDDYGETWTKPVAIEQPGKESASWAMPYLTNYGRIYVFYVYNGDKIHELNGSMNIREDMLGWYCYKYSDDEGKTWSRRYRLDVRKTNVDLNNDWKGKVQILWGIGKPIDFGGGMMFAFSKVGKYLIDHTEGWFFRCKNINIEREPEKLEWELLPGGDDGLKNASLGPINEEQNILQMNDGTLYCMERTISGHPAESYSYDGGETWTIPKIPHYSNGLEIKNPRACARVWKCNNGKFLLWYHNNGGWDFMSRNPVWLSGGIEKNGKIIWGQPEILLYEDEKDERISYPDLVEQDGRYWITETNKKAARIHEIPSGFLNSLWAQFEIKTVTTRDLVVQWEEETIAPQKKFEDIGADVDYQPGFTIDFRLKLGTLAPGQIILSSTNNKKCVVVKTGDYGSIEIVLDDGTDTVKWNSDPGLISAYGEHCVSVIVDNGPKVIQFIVDGIVCNGQNFRKYGWKHFKPVMDDFIFNNVEVGELAAGQLRPKGKLCMLRIYNRPLMNTEVIGNHRSFTR